MSCWENKMETVLFSSLDLLWLRSREVPENFLDQPDPKRYAKMAKAQSAINMQSHNGRI